ncbi:hypothetical protein L1987_22316 [Smallanthus sonchifolius]|uniref:Uncharacterized protein n=1 Tax=Smallanthus sonchifolius TaxID=185202 RepID=A0ACB9IG03_9ASTR|nr:hypothetical protein L1987_22316 [Smallanthus sonchifolius]
MDFMAISASSICWSTRNHTLPEMAISASSICWSTWSHESRVQRKKPSFDRSGSGEENDSFVTLSSRGEEEEEEEDREGGSHWPEMCIEKLRSVTIG